MRTFSFTHGKLAAIPTALVAIGLLAGCQGPTALRTSFYHYSEAYASSVNEQMLLNLARRANGHPAYFLQMGLINSTFTFSGAVGGNTTSSRGKNQIGPTITTEVLSGGGTLNLSAAEQPTFTFTPLAGSTFAQAIFAPISPTIFFSLLDQGRPVDQLMRAMVYAVDFTYRRTNGPPRTFTIHNVPDLERQADYRNFLRLAATYRELQKAALLDVALETNQIGFRFKPGVAEKLQELRQRKEYQLEPESEWEASQMSQIPPNQIPIVSLRLRTFEGVLGAVATEAATYDLAVNDPTHPIPASEREPILRIDGTGGVDPSTRLVAVTYMGKRYQIGDSSPKVTWNRDIFILLNHLFTQVSIDPDKLPVQQLIQLH
ncbi:MAG: hypothetical protein KGS61_02175 [Verrucomicrobia bacterium]|nr:hypothetical protein [Verrucomicrobiota bacterium]